MVMSGSGSNYVLLLGLAGLVLLAGLAVMAPALAPAFEEVRLRDHAVYRHGETARTARETIQNCGTGLQVWSCPETVEHPPGWLFVCPVDGARIMCAGMVVGSRGAELTSWMMPCVDWYARAARCTAEGGGE